MICKLSKERIIDLIDNVVFPIADEVKKECSDREKTFKFKVALTKLALILLLLDKAKIKVFRQKGISLRNLHILNEEQNKKLLKEFLELHSKWEKVNCDIETKQSEENEDDFFDFESEEIDSNINNMHYQEKDKINAVDFMNKHGIDEDLEMELNDLITEIEDFIYQYEDIDLDEDFMEKLSFLDSFIKAFNFSDEFMDIGYALVMFKEKISELDINSLNDEQKNMLKLMVISILKDLVKWVDEVVINQTAQDIHYLDASLLANIAQIDIMLKSFENKDDDEDELELF